MSFELKEVFDILQKKKDIYVPLVANAYNVSNERAENILISEMELFKERLKKYYTSEMTSTSYRPNPVPPSMTMAQGTNIFLEVISESLTFSPSANLVYLSRLTGTGTAIGWQTTARGELFLSVNSGRISHVTEPIIVRNSEDFKVISDLENTEKVIHTREFSTDNFTYESDFKLGYCYLVYANGSRELSITDRSKMNDAYSKSKNKAGYNSIAMLQSKVVKRALSYVQKKPTSRSMEVVEDFIEMVENGEINLQVDSEIITEPSFDFTSISETFENEKPEPEPEPSAPSNDLTDGLDFNF